MRRRTQSRSATIGSIPRSLAEPRIAASDTSVSIPIMTARNVKGRVPSTPKSTARRNGVPRPSTIPPPITPTIAGLARFVQHRSHVPGIAGAKRQANRELPSTTGHAKRGHRVHARGRKQQRGSSKDSHQPEIRSSRCNRRLEHFVHRFHRGRRHVAIDELHLASNGLPQGVRLDRGPKAPVHVVRQPLDRELRDLGNRHVDVGGGFGFESNVLHVADNADDRCPSLHGAVGHHDLFVQRGLVPQRRRDNRRLTRTTAALDAVSWSSKRDRQSPECRRCKIAGRDHSVVRFGHLSRGRGPDDPRATGRRSRDSC